MHFRISAMPKKEYASYENIENGWESSNASTVDKQKKYFPYIYITVFIMATFLIGYYAGPHIDIETLLTFSSLMGASKSSTGSSPSISIYNEYTIDRPLSGGYPWEYIVEPYKVTTLEVTNPNSEVTYKWYIDGWHQGDGTVITTAFTEVTGKYQTINVQMIASSGKVMGSSSISVMCKYVRREIRELIDQDREAFFQAVAILQRVPTQTGKKIYGTKYRSRDYFNRIHLYYGGSKSCDHWHQGPGFVTSHVTFSLMYEQALQSVNPSISLPYWDFTLESTFYNPSTFRNSGVFSPDWFGDATCNNTEHTPNEGRFSYVPVMQDATNFSDIVSPYGLLRSPWNADPFPYMTRSSLIFGMDNNLKPSGCLEYHHALTFKDWQGLAKQLNSNAHGHIHELIGGSWNPEEGISRPESDSGLADAYEFAHATEAYSKILWRYNFLLCPEAEERCTMSTRPEDCKCKCTVESLQNMSSAHILSNTGIIKGLVFYDKDGNPVENWQNMTTKKAYEQLPGYSYNETQAMYDEIMDILCNPGYIGDMFQATSTNDITFWILHPTLERLWHLTRVNAGLGLIDFDHTWPDDDVTCHGHYSYDPTPFKNIFDDNNTLYTNGELYSLLDPTQNSFPYIYDNFRWSHCTFLGYDMTGLETSDDTGHS